MHKFKFLARGIGAAVTAVVAVCGLSAGAFATQTVFPATTSTATAGSPQDLTGDTVTVPAGTSYTFFGIYSATGNAVESGLGVKVKFDPTRIASATVADAASGELMTKCMIAPPQVQSNQIVFGWIDTSVRTTPTAGAVAWPWGADVAGAGVTSACLSPNTPANSTAAIAAAANLRLFRVTLTTAAGFTSGTTPINIQADGNISYASGTPGFTDTSFTIQAAAAPSCNLDVDGSGGAPSSNVDGLLIRRALNGFIAESAILTGVTLPGSATRTTGAAIRAYVLGLGNVLDVDGNGSGTPSANVDGFLIQRALNTFLASSAVTTGISTSATGAQIRTYLNNNCGTTLTP